MLELLQALKAKGYRLYLLSNAATRQPIYWARAEASKLMDGALISAEAKLLKPDPQIYRTFLRKFALRPEECAIILEIGGVRKRVYTKERGFAYCFFFRKIIERLFSERDEERNEPIG